MLAASEEVVKLSRKSKLSDAFFAKAERPLAYLSDKLGISALQATFLSMFMDNFNERYVSIEEIADHFGISNIRVLYYLNEVDQMIRMGYIRRNTPNEIRYSIPWEMVEAFRNDTTLERKDISNLSIRQFFCAMQDLFESLENDELDYDILELEIAELLTVNRHLEFVKKVMSNSFSTSERILMLRIFSLAVSENFGSIHTYQLAEAIPNKSHQRSVIASIEEGKHPLFGMGIIEYAKNDGIADRTLIALTYKAQREYLAELEINVKPSNSRNLLNPDEIVTKQLFYNDTERQQIDRLSAALHPDSFSQLQQQLAAEGLRGGFTCLFYGAPGTGKTETVLQLAKATNRPVMQVNFAQMKSCWVGESEKNVKALFDEYRDLVKNSETTPILLFNEADALLGTRMKGAERSVEKMENAIQNIILQEMENLDGIMIATTNLTENLDKAFERRFLYKIRFDRPALEARKNIWKSMLPMLDDGTLTQLATDYSFSGGQIENIARKQRIESIIANVPVTAETIKGYCQSECISETPSAPRRRIGYVQC